MSWKEDYINLRYRSRKVSQLIDGYNNEVEIETVQYSDHYHVVATICQEEPPYYDCFGEGRDENEREAVKIALKELYGRTYGQMLNQGSIPIDFHN